MPNNRFPSAEEHHQKVVQSQNEAAITAENAKQKTEFERYKQDCRKRAAELAFQQWSIAGEQFKSTTEYSKGTLFDFDILKRADEYYNWLISIPQ